jgi:putative phosphoesterase
MAARFAKETPSRSPRASDRAAAAALRIGLISDTHGLLRPAAVEALGGVDAIVHAGDVGDPQILEALRTIAPVVAVRGNIDREAWADALPESATFEAGGVLVHVVHDRATLAIDPAANGIHAIIFGHSHRPSIERRDEVLFVNPGSAGPRRFTLPVTVALLTITEGRAEAALVELRV